jgi:hypothetical protein
MHVGRIVFAQLIANVPPYEFRKGVERYSGNFPLIPGTFSLRAENVETPELHLATELVRCPQTCGRIGLVCRSPGKIQRTKWSRPNSRNRRRQPALTHSGKVRRADILLSPSASSGQSTAARLAILKEYLEPMLSRDLRLLQVICTKMPCPISATKTTGISPATS